MLPEAARVWPAPAKINLFLHIVGRRPDGYHLIQTVFQFVELYDELRFTPRADGQIRLLTPLPGVPPQQDLCVRAAQALRAHTGCRLGVDIELTKRIPIGGGLGGGSSDAATTLLALNRLWALDLPRTELVAIGLALGADVPVFIGGRAAWAEGIGELLTPIDLDEPWYLIVDPGVAVATASVFGHPKLTRHTLPITISALPQRAYRQRLPGRSPRAVSAGRRGVPMAGRVWPGASFRHRRVPVCAYRPQAGCRCSPGAASGTMARLGGARPATAIRCWPILPSK